MSKGVTAAKVQRDRRARALHFVVIVVWDGADVLRHRNGKPARGLDISGQYIDEGGPAFLSAREGHHKRRDLVLEPPQIVWAAARQHNNDQLPGCDHRLKQLLLDARQVE